MLSRKPFGSLLDALWSALGTSGKLLGGSWEALGLLLGGSWRLLGALWDHMGALECSQAVIKVILGGAGRILVPLGALLEPLGEVLGASWEPLRSILESFWSCLGMILELGQRFRSNLLKY